MSLKHIIISISTLFAISFLALIPNNASAAYDGNNIIDDAILFDTSTMDENSIHNFLLSMNSGLSSRSFIFDCAATDASAELYRKAGAPCGQNARSSQIIYYASKIYGINPRVILATLQKEQSLITTTDPASWQINQAMGFNCPTRTGCGSSDFLYQIDNGTFTLRFNAERAMGNNTYWFTSSYWVCGTTRDFYKPSLYPQQNVDFYDEDGVYYRTHYVKTAATSAFYCYTPHAYNNPNGLYGLPKYGSTGRYYSGSYNFVTYFEKWFGSTQNPTYSWEVKNLNIYDEGKNTIIATDQLHAGERLWVSLKVKNIGSTTWYRDGDNPATLGTSNQRNHTSKYCDTTWLSCNRVTKIKESSIAPGEEGHFEFYMAASNILGEFREYFEPVLENESWMINNTGFHIYTQTLNDYAWKWFSYDAWLNSEHTLKADVNQLSKNQLIYVTVYAKNTSATIWKKDGPYPVRLATSNPKNRSSALCDPSWLNCSRLASANEDTVLPGQIASFSFSIKAPSTIGEFREYIRPVIEYAGWTTEDINHMYLRVSQ